jgi:chromosomal replication initiation ATPase DnaA
MLLIGIAKQIEEEVRARARRYEAEYLAKIFRLDDGRELPRCADTTPGGASNTRRSAAEPSKGVGDVRFNGVWEARARKAMPRFEDIVSAVGEATHIAPAEMHSRSRHEHIAYARQLAMYLMRQLTHASYPLIGAFFGRDHSTVFYACESMRGRLPFDAEGRRALDKIATIFSDRRRQLQQDRRNEQTT